MKRSPILSAPRLFAYGGALFSMHFGATSLVWPMTWGKRGADALLASFTGVFLSALLLPFLGYLALARGQGNFHQLTLRLLPRTGPVFTYAAIIILGPLYVLPRVSASCWDAGAQCFGLGGAGPLPPLAFSFGFYALVYCFAANRSHLIQRISQILFPVLICFVIVIIALGLARPLSPLPPQRFSAAAASLGFTEGYATAELLCALIYGAIILRELKSEGIGASGIRREIVKVALIGMGILTLSHLGHMYIGASSGQSIPLLYVSLYTEVAMRLLGRAGGLIFTFALVMASLTASVGISAAVTQFMEDASGGRLSYSRVLPLTAVTAALIGSLGLSQILSYLTPLLEVLYPPAIVLTLYYAFMPDCLNPRRLAPGKWAMAAGLLSGLLNGAAAYLRLFALPAQAFWRLYRLLPLADLGLSWLPAAALALAAGFLARNLGERRAKRAGKSLSP